MKKFLLSVSLLTAILIVLPRILDAADGSKGASKTAQPALSAAASADTIAAVRLTMAN